MEDGQRRRVPRALLAPQPVRPGRQRRADPGLRLHHPALRRAGARAGPGWGAAPQGLQLPPAARVGAAAAPWACAWPGGAAPGRQSCCGSSSTEQQPEDCGMLTDRGHCAPPTPCARAGLPVPRLARLAADRRPGHVPAAVGGGRLLGGLAVGPGQPLVRGLVQGLLARGLLLPGRHRAGARWGGGGGRGHGCSVWVRRRRTAACMPGGSLGWRLLEPGAAQVTHPRPPRRHPALPAVPQVLTFLNMFLWGTGSSGAIPLGFFFSIIFLWWVARRRGWPAWRELRLLACL